MPAGPQVPLRAGIECASFARKSSATPHGALAAILVEPMQGTAGKRSSAPEFLPAIREIADESDALLVADEMITGFGRTGALVRRRAHRSEAGHHEPWARASLALPVSGSSRRTRSRAPSLGQSSGRARATAECLAGGRRVRLRLRHRRGRPRRQLRARRPRDAAGSGICRRSSEFIGTSGAGRLLIGVELVKDRVTREPLDKAVCVRALHECLPARPRQHGLQPALPHQPSSLHQRGDGGGRPRHRDEAFAWLAREGGWR